MRTVGDGDDAGGVEHLDEHHQVILGLEDLDVVVVGDGKDGQPGRPQAAVEVAEVLDLLERRRPERPGRAEPGAALVGPRGPAAVRRVDDERGPPGLDHLGAKVHPEAVVRADRPARLGALGRRPIRRLVLLDRPLLERPRLFLGQELAVAVPFRALERRQGPEVPHAVQIGHAPRRSRHVGGLGGNGGRRQQQRQCEQGGHGLMRCAHSVLSRQGSLRQVSLTAYPPRAPTGCQVLDADTVIHRTPRRPRS